MGLMTISTNRQTDRQTSLLWKMIYNSPSGSIDQRLFFFQITLVFCLFYEPRPNDHDELRGFRAGE